MVVITAQLCEYNKNHWREHFKGVNFMACELYLKLLLKKKLRNLPKVPQLVNDSLQIQTQVCLTPEPMLSTIM